MVSMIDNWIVVLDKIIKLVKYLLMKVFFFGYRLAIEVDTRLKSLSVRSPALQFGTALYSRMTTKI